MLEKTVEQTEPEVYTALRELNRATDLLSDVVGMLGERTNFARCFGIKSNVEASHKNVPHRSELANQIYSSRDAVEAIKSRITDIIEELEI